MNAKNEQAWLEHVCRIAVQAGEQILSIYFAAEPAEVEQKSDGTPVTLADKEADELISEALRSLTPDIPLVTEESIETVPFENRQAWSRFWLVDPLDGTKEFIERTGEFSVNIALVTEGKPVLGVVYVPVTRILYCAMAGLGAYKNRVPKNPDSQFWQACMRPESRIFCQRLNSKKPIRVAVSRRHGGSVKQFMQALGSVETVKMGSAIKTCLVAEGAADVYPRFGPTSLWDTAAAQCVVEEAGGKLLDKQGLALTYRQTETLLNPHFMVIGDTNYPWPDFP